MRTQELLTHALLGLEKVHQVTNQKKKYEKKPKLFKGAAYQRARQQKVFWFEGRVGNIKTGLSNSSEVFGSLNTLIKKRKF